MRLLLIIKLNISVRISIDGRHTMNANQKTFKINKKGIYSYEKSNVRDYNFFAWNDGDFVWCSIKHNKIETYKIRIMKSDIPKHRYDAHVYFYNLFGVYNQSAIQSDKVSFLARLADQLHKITEKCLVDYGFEVEEPDPTRYTAKPIPRDKSNPDIGFRVYRQNGKFNPFTHQYEYPEDAPFNPEYKGYDTLDDVSLKEKINKALFDYAIKKGMQDESFLIEAMLNMAQIDF